MFYRIIDEKIYDWADYKYADDCLETDITNKNDFDLNFERYTVQNGILVDISSTEAFIQEQTEKENAAKKVELQSKIDELDKKRIRAIAEPALKDPQSGQTWLEYYTAQIKALRGEMG